MDLDGTLVKSFITTWNFYNIYCNYVIFDFILIHYCNALPHRKNIAEGWYDNWSPNFL